jgi:hypothetical protein
MRSYDPNVNSADFLMFDYEVWNNGKYIMYRNANSKRGVVDSAGSIICRFDYDEIILDNTNNTIRAIRTDENGVNKEDTFLLKD